MLVLLTMMLVLSCLVDVDDCVVDNHVIDDHVIDNDACPVNNDARLVDDLPQPLASQLKIKRDPLGELNPERTLLCQRSSNSE